MRRAGGPGTRGDEFQRAGLKRDHFPVGSVDRLIVIASAGAPAPPAGTAVVRFAGIPTAGERVPADLGALRDAAADIVKRTYPAWLDGWATSSGAMDLATWEGNLSWWWYSAMSERSPQRTVLIHQLHQLTLLRLALLRWRVKRLTWYNSSSAMLRAVGRVAAAAGCAVEPIRTGRRAHPAVAVAVRLYAVVRELIRAAAARLLVPKGFRPEARALCFTRFPVLWECADGDWRERMFGKLPGVLAQRGLPVAYAAIATGGPVAWLRNWRSWRAALSEKRIYLLQAQATIVDLAVALLPVGLWVRYLKWRRRAGTWRAAFDGIDAGELLRAAMDGNVLDPNLAVNRLVARTLPHVLRREPGIGYLLHPFEFQPMERAAAIGSGIGKAVRVVGLQTGLFTSGQMGFNLRRGELRLDPADRGRRERAPIPDLVAAYGRLPSRILAEALGTSRVIEVGATRYGGLAEFAAQPYGLADQRRELGLPAGFRHLLIAATAIPEEAWPIIHAARAVAAAHPDIFLSFKFHYHLPLDAAVADALSGVADGRWKIFDTHLHRLIRAADIVVTGASSVAYEALALGRRSLIYLSPAAFHCNPATETPDAFRFWHSAEELMSLMADGTAIVPAVASEALRDQMEVIADGELRLCDAMERADAWREAVAHASA